MKSKTFTREDFERWGSKGGKARKAPRILTSAQAKRMVKIREAKKTQ